MRDPNYRKLKKEWINKNLNVQGIDTKKIDVDVIKFIADTLFTPSFNSTLYIYYFRICRYYFASLLHHEFNRGKVYYSDDSYKDAVWIDDNGVAYDVSGVLVNYKQKDQTPIENTSESNNINQDNTKSIYNDAEEF